MSWIPLNQESRHPSLPVLGARGFFAGLIVLSLGMVACGGGDDAEPTQAAASPTSQAGSPEATTSSTKPAGTTVGSATAGSSATTAATEVVVSTEVASPTATTAAAATATTTSPAAQPTATTPPPPPTATSVPPTATTKPAPQPVSINLTDGPQFRFQPANVTVPAGTTVTWVWGGAAFHDVTGPGFGSTTKESGTYSFTFNTPGTYNYNCTVHSSSQPPMTGRIVVQ